MLIFAASLLALTSLGRADVPVPAPSSYVTDLTGTLTPAEAGDLDQRLHAFEAQKGSQLTVLIVPTTAPETIAQYGIRVAEQWKAGRKNVDDGAILLIAKGDRTVRIEVGYGLEGALTDETSGRIIREIITPRFREGNFYGGISAGIEEMMRVINGEPLPPPPPRGERSGSQLRVLAPIFFLLILVLGGFTRSSLGRFPGAIVTGGVLGLLAWLVAGAFAVAIFAGLIGFFFTLLGGVGGSMMGGSRYGGWGGGFGGGFGGGGFGGGGFGGGGFSGGGGGFGGGGASGRW